MAEDVASDPAPPHPTARTAPLDPPPGLAACRATDPVRRMRYPDGHLGWLVTDHALARAVLTDPRFSARSEFKRSPVARPGADGFYGAPALPGWLVDMDAPRHTRIRRQLAGLFTARRMRALRPRADRVVADLLDAMAAAGPPADLVGAFALPVPSLMVCELLGVPTAERAGFQRDTEILFSLTASADEVDAAMDRLYGFLRAVAAEGGARPGVLSALAAAGELDTEEIAGVGVLLLTAGHESTGSSLALGVFALLTNPAQLAAFTADPALTGNAVEELMRYLSVFHLGVPRTPLVDLEFAGHRMAAGESVTVSIPAANRDPAWFGPTADELRVDRRASGHLAFGYGVHQCLGQNLVRVELAAALPALFARFPSLALAVPADEVPVSGDHSVFGVRALPVTW